jgi:hypothetical protein
MNRLESNIFPIANLKDLTTRYRTYRLRGLSRSSPDYFKNRDLIVRRLSSPLKAPVEIYEMDEDIFLAVPEHTPELPDTLMMVRTPVRLEPMEGIRVLDYTTRSPWTDRLCTRFINFMVQGPLFSKVGLWQPHTGGAFFDKTPVEVNGGIGRYEGFTVRSVITEDGGIGLCVDVTSCFVDQKPLPARIGRQEFRKLKGRHAIYRFGHQWYDIALLERHDLKVNEYGFDVKGKTVSLAEYIEAESRKPIPPELAKLDPEGAVVVYLDRRTNAERGVPAGLCYLTHDTESREVRASHRRTIMAPGIRHSKILDVCRRHLVDIRIGGTTLHLSSAPRTIPRQVFPMPDLLFGNGVRLSVGGTNRARSVPLSGFGRARAECLSSASAGFFTRSRLDRQYLFLPKTVADSWGKQFSEDLTAAVRAMYPHGGYAPVPVIYNDVGIGRTFVEQARAILAAAKIHCTQPGFAAVMIHDVERHGRRAHDQLEAAVLREFWKLSPSIRASVLHSTVGGESYEQFTDASGNPSYRVRGDRRSKFSGYVRNVALSKVLLTNEKWPFVLADPLHADLTIGIDVKHHTVGYSVVSGAGRSIRFHCEASQQSEKLASAQIRSQLEEIVRAEFADQGRSLGSIVIHRDGRAFPEECDGAAQAIEALRAEGVLRPDATLTIVEISKTERSMLRFFDVKDESGRQARIDNPQVGQYYITGRDAYLATTGLPFARPGTSKPLHIRYVVGGLRFKDCLEDIYRLSVLAWGRPDDCSRLPITIKMTDRALGEEATEYDEDALRYGTPPKRASA